LIIGYSNQKFRLVELLDRFVGHDKSGTTDVAAAGGSHFLMKECEAGEPLSHALE
jgi:hypothetical protein